MLATRCEALVRESQGWHPAKRHAAITVFAAWALLTPHEYSDATLHLCSLRRECISIQQPLLQMGRRKMAQGQPLAAARKGYRSTLSMCR